MLFIRALGLAFQSVIWHPGFIVTAHSKSNFLKLPQLRVTEYLAVFMVTIQKANLKSLSL